MLVLDAYNETKKQNEHASVTPERGIVFQTELTDSVLCWPVPVADAEWQ
jgi:hypothetical protein